MTPFHEFLKRRLASDNPTSFLKLFLITWAIMIIALAFFIDNKWVLAAMIAYEVLP